MINEQQLLASYRALPSNMQLQVFDFIRLLWLSVKERQQADESLLSAVRPIRQTISMEEIRKEQSHKKPSRMQVRMIAEDMNIEESVSDLLKALSA
jgi:hypothetical protein